MVDVKNVVPESLSGNVKIPIYNGSQQLFMVRRNLSECVDIFLSEIYLHFHKFSHGLIQVLEDPILTYTENQAMENVVGIKTRLHRPEEIAIFMFSISASSPRMVLSLSAQSFL